MLKRHQLLLSKNYEFLVMEIPMDPTLEALRSRKVLTSHDFEQLRTLRHQGRRALARYLLAVLPVRGPNAFKALLESLQEANAQHLVDLLVAQSGAENVEQLIKIPPAEGGPPRTPSDTPLPAGPDPHEYAVRLARNNKLIREFVDPSSISPVLAQNKVISAREADMVLHLNGKNKKWDLILSAILQRGERAYQAFMAALLQKNYSTMFHTIQETPTVGSDTDPDLDNDDYNTSGDEDDVDDTIDSINKASQTHPLNSDHFEESDDELKAEAIASVMARNRNVADADTQTRGYTPNHALLNGSRDLQDDGVPPTPQNRNGSRISQRSNSGPVNNQNGDDNVSNNGEQIPTGQNSARPDTSNSMQSNGAPPPSNTQDNPAANKSPSKSQRRRSSAAGNLNSLQEEDESSY
ncbi:hypothetical protein EGW08_006342 [Elysia chlorotica]|uniref:CARD domain-containing protein n=1 Tax=Elysia chlorotica TaxID=188477 RepID=A0A3S1A9A7_ELYCH|nr:hypothetical protein EGW08_006342 [Elysia chlorotica]